MPMAEAVRSEFVLAVKGKVIPRPEGTVNPNMKTGEVEIQVLECKLLNRSKPLPFMLDEHSDVNENIRLKYRYLDLRRPQLQYNLILRSKVAQVTRSYLTDNGFIELETPFLTKSTPEGARDFLVPSRINQGQFYALPQSPQIFKQILMISGFDRYFQVVRCFRDEDLRADRQPEFTQIDCEMSFIDREDIITVMEGLIARIFREAKGVDDRSCRSSASPMPRPSGASASTIRTCASAWNCATSPISSRVPASRSLPMWPAKGGIIKGHQRQGMRQVLPQGDR